MRLLDGLHITKIRLITWPKKLNGRGMDDRIVTALAWKPGSDADEMWLALTEFANRDGRPRWPVKEKEVA